jgi:hypothetical protein
VKAVQKMLGHPSAAMTLDVYADRFDDDLDSVAHRLNEAATSASVRQGPTARAAFRSTSGTKEKGPGGPFSFVARAGLEPATPRL